MRAFQMLGLVAVLGAGSALWAGDAPREGVKKRARPGKKARRGMTPEQMLSHLERNLKHAKQKETGLKRYDGLQSPQAQALLKEVKAQHAAAIKRLTEHIETAKQGQMPQFKWGRRAGSGKMMVAGRMLDLYAQKQRTENMKANMGDNAEAIAAADKSCAIIDKMIANLGEIAQLEEKHAELQGQLSEARKGTWRRKPAGRRGKGPKAGKGGKGQPQRKKEEAPVDF